MNVLHVIPSVAADEGGPSVAVRALAAALNDQGVRVTVAATGDEEHFLQSAVLDAPVAVSQPEYLYFKRTLTVYKVSINLVKWLRRHLSDFDLVHIHALFSFSSSVAALIARNSNVAYVVRPLGVLNRWGMENRRTALKMVSFRIVELPILLHSAAIHYTSEAERCEANLLDDRLAKHRSVVLPLPVESPLSAARERLIETYPQLQGRKIVLFLSRIDPKKGVELLLDAFGSVRKEHPETALVIAGEGGREYMRGLRDRPSAIQNSEDIFWTGHLTGQMKSAAFAAANVFVLASASENFGIAAAEALAAGVPTIVSEEVGLSHDIREYDAGVVVKRHPHRLGDAITDLLDNEQKARRLAENGKRLAGERYSPDAIGSALKRLYTEIVEERQRR